MAAKGGRPVAFLLDLLVPPGTSENWARAVVDGAETQLARFGAHIVGGDTKPSPRASVIGTLVGTARRNRLAPRTDALPGDLVVTTGTVGRGGLALLGWDRAKTSKAARDRLLRVRPRVPEGPRLARWAHAMLDTSDGLADSARLLAAASGVRIIVEAERLPIDPGLRRAVPDPAERLRHAFLGGDYELLATVAPESFPAARATLRRLGCPLTEIGSVEAGTGAWLKQEGPRRPMPEGGWRPFRLGHSRRPS
ncbi:MAG: thiamine-phosphate kinase [Thermoplasmata archaeon]|nr:thiamine-phosphate kinase [Thermoplasmata archaeon]